MFAVSGASSLTRETRVETKALMIGTLLLLDYTFFDKDQCAECFANSFANHFWYFWHFLKIKSSINRD